MYNFALTFTGSSPRRRALKILKKGTSFSGSDHHMVDLDNLKKELLIANHKIKDL